MTIDWGNEAVLPKKSRSKGSTVASEDVGEDAEYLKRWGRTKVELFGNGNTSEAMYEAKCGLCGKGFWEHRYYNCPELVPR